VKRLILLQIFAIWSTEYLAPVKLEKNLALDWGLLELLIRIGEVNFGEFVRFDKFTKMGCRRKFHVLL